MARTGLPGRVRVGEKTILLSIMLVVRAGVAAGMDTPFETVPLPRHRLPFMQIVLRVLASQAGEQLEVQRFWSGAPVRIDSVFLGRNELIFETFGCGHARRGAREPFILVFHNEEADFVSLDVMGGGTQHGEP